MTCNRAVLNENGCAITQPLNKIDEVQSIEIWIHESLHLAVRFLQMLARSVPLMRSKNSDCPLPHRERKVGLLSVVNRS